MTLRKRQITFTLSDDEYAALQSVSEWRALNVADTIRGLITREAEVAPHLSPLQADAALGTACHKAR